MLNINGATFFICILHTFYEEPIEIYMASSPVFSPSKKMAFLIQISYFLLIFYRHPYTYKE